MSRELDELKEQVSELSKQGRLNEVGPVLEQAAELTRQEYGDEHAAYAAILNEVGGLYRATGEYTKSERAFVKAMDILAKFPGKDHPDYATTINNLAGLYRLTGDHSKAESLFLEAIDVYAETIGRKHFLEIKEALDR